MLLGIAIVCLHVDETNLFEKFREVINSIEPSSPVVLKTLGQIRYLIIMLAATYKGIEQHGHQRVCSISDKVDHVDNSLQPFSKEYRYRIPLPSGTGIVLDHLKRQLQDNCPVSMQTGNLFAIPLKNLNFI